MVLVLPGASEKLFGLRRMAPHRPFIVGPPWKTVFLQSTGKSAATAAAPHGDVVEAAAFPDADADFPFDEFADDGLPYDDDLDAAYPASFPEDPFPEALFAEVLFTDGAALVAGTSRARFGGADRGGKYPASG
ncbi:hypothetical protein [Arthrobacter ipis]|uniref:hypothetical protein n=1 Tax=Arthrobacter ipis TaxID=2716202 RepID=UPI00188BCB65|nr:hypothetical protein [Arthrobacter ipis]